MLRAWMSSKTDTEQAARVGRSSPLQSSLSRQRCAQRAHLPYSSCTSEWYCPLKNTSLIPKLHGDKHCPLCRGSAGNLSPQLQCRLQALRPQETSKSILGTLTPRARRCSEMPMSLDTRDTGEGLCQVGQAEKESFYCLGGWMFRK